MADEVSQEQSAQISQENPNTNVEIVGSIGLASKLLKEKSTLKPYNCWMGISTSKKTYPDEMVVEYAKWATEHSDHFMLVVADGMQIYNQIAQKRINISHVTEEQAKWIQEEAKEYYKEAKKRKLDLETKFKKAGIQNFHIHLWSHVFELLERDEMDKWIVQSFREMAYYPGIDLEFDEGIRKIVEERAGHLLSRIGKSKLSEFILGLYAREEWALVMALGTLGIYKYSIKIGPEGERGYDELVMDVFLKGFGSLKTDPYENNANWFGAVYLKHNPNVTSNK